MITKLFLQLRLHLYGTRCRVALVYVNLQHMGKIKAESILYK